MELNNQTSIGGIIHIVLVVWAVWDLLASRRSGCSTIVWLVFIICAPCVGPVCYLLFGRSRGGS